MTTAHRISGVAPLAVFFDAVDVTPAAVGTQEYYASPYPWTSRVFQPADYEGTLYEWDFGDPDSGTWSTTGKSKNKATGFTAAHVFENPGTYTVGLRVIDASGTAMSYVQQITVSAFTGTTYYISSARGTDAAGNGLSMSSPLKTVDYAINNFYRTNVRFLFRRGDTFTTNNYFNLTQKGPVIFGAYGDEQAGHGDAAAKPVIQCNNTGEITFRTYFGNGTDPDNGSDHRFVDLVLSGPGRGLPHSADNPSAGPVGPATETSVTDLLVLRVDTNGWRDGFAWSQWREWNYTHPSNGVFIVETTDSNGNTEAGYVGAARLAILGNYLHDSYRSHTLRVWQAHKAVISNNHLQNPGGNRHCLKLHAASYGGSDRDAVLAADGGDLAHSPGTRWVTINDNWFEANVHDTVTNPENSIWMVSMGPQDSGNDERVSHVVVERNRFTGSAPNLMTAIESSASNVIVRNNVVNTTAGGDFITLWFYRRGIEPAPVKLRVYANTLYKSNANSDTTLILVTSDVTQADVQNNLGVSPAGGSVIMLNMSSSSGTENNNLSSVASASSFFTNAGAGDFSLVSGATSAIDKGTALSAVHEDFMRSSRPKGFGYDIGAFESH